MYEGENQWVDVISPDFDLIGNLDRERAQQFHYLNGLLRDGYHQWRWGQSPRDLIDHKAPFEVLYCHQHTFERWRKTVQYVSDKTEFANEPLTDEGFPTRQRRDKRESPVVRKRQNQASKQARQARFIGWPKKYKDTKKDKCKCHRLIIKGNTVLALPNTLRLAIPLFFV